MPYGDIFIPYIVQCQAILSIYGTIYYKIIVKLLQFIETYYNLFQINDKLMIILFKFTCFS